MPPKGWGGGGGREGGGATIGWQKAGVPYQHMHLYCMSRSSRGLPRSCLLACWHLLGGPWAPQPHSHCPPARSGCCHRRPALLPCTTALPALSQSTKYVGILHHVHIAPRLMYAAKECQDAGVRIHSFTQCCTNPCVHARMRGSKCCQLNQRDTLLVAPRQQLASDTNCTAQALDTNLQTSND